MLSVKYFIDMLNDIMLCVVILGVIMMSVASLIHMPSNAECHYTECDIFKLLF